jgi:hypothetical protein
VSRPLPQLAEHVHGDLFASADGDNPAGRAGIKVAHLAASLMCQLMCCRSCRSAYAKDLVCCSDAHFTLSSSAKSESYDVGQHRQFESPILRQLNSPAPTAAGVLTPSARQTAHSVGLDPRQLDVGEGDQGRAAASRSQDTVHSRAAATGSRA